MILPGGPARVFVATKPVDFRRGLDGLSAIVQEQLQLDPFGGSIFVFRAKRADRVKILVWDGTGLTMIYKRLEGAKFSWPRIEDGCDAVVDGAVVGAVRGVGVAAGSQPPCSPSADRAISAATD